MSNNYIKTLDPIQGLYDYVLDIKPYHTKIVEVLIEYVYDDDVVTIVDETLTLCWGRSAVPIASMVWGGSPSNLVTLTGDWTNALSVGELVYIGDKMYGGICGLPATAQSDGSPYSEPFEYTVVSITPNGGSPATSTTIEISGVDNVTVPSGKFQLPGDVTAYFSFVIEEINATDNYIIVTGPATADVFNGQMIRFTNTASNDGDMMVMGSPTFNGLVTRIPVAGPLTAETVVGTPTITPPRYFVL